MISGTPVAPQIAITTSRALPRASGNHIIADSTRAVGESQHPPQHLPARPIPEFTP
jgi:hypothetical protein